MPRQSRIYKQPQGPYINLEPFRWADAINGLALGPKSLLLLLARRSDQYGCSFYRQEILGNELGCSRRSVRDHVRALEKHGLVRTIGRLEHFRQTSNVYHLVGWTGRTELPASGHPSLGKYIKEPPHRDFLAALRRQNLLHHPANPADHNNINEITSTSAEEETLEACLEALGEWLSPQERELLREDCLALFSLLEQGSSLTAHILPVLREKAQTKRSNGVIQKWRYFAHAIAEHRIETNREIDEAFSTREAAASMQTAPATETAEGNFLESLLHQTRARAASSSGDTK